MQWKQVQALMADHVNTNAIKVMVLHWFCSRLQCIRKDEVRRACFCACAAKPPDMCMYFVCNSIHDDYAL